MSVLLEFSMTPLDKGESVSTYVARSLEIIDQSGLPYRLGPMGTCLEGEWLEVIAVVGKCLERMGQDCNRVSISIRADYRKGRRGGLTKKIASVQRKVGRRLST